ncbi:MAG: PEP-CTERM sorting domain-containing protein [Akkermansia sp.]|nr:PEP-CTERM sorting domain-containing protein [Akkermansia sp.]
MRTNGIRFLDYDVRVGNNFEGEDEFLFSHYCNLIVDGAQDYELKYDLRDAKAPGSPVDALRVKLATDDDWLSSYEVFTDEEVPTGDLLLRGGKVTLVNCADGREKLDGGGKVEGVIRFQDSVVKGTTDTIQEANRTLKVDRTDTIAKEINLSATKGTNTLEVTEDNVATFGKLTGTGNLAKTGTGTAEVTEEVSLKGSINVQQGKFVLGVNATLSADTVLTVAKDAQMASTADKPVTLSITSGVHINDGEMTLTTTISESATLKGSGRFGKVTVDGGTLIVGNSPGHQEFEDSLTLKSGRVVFSVAGFNEAASLTSTGGWDSGTYSTIDMNGHEFIVALDGQIIIALSREAANSLTMAGGDFAMELVSGMSNTLTDEQLAALAKQTTFQLSEELAAQSGRATLATPDYFAYQMVGNKLMLTSGAGDNQTVPEPATSTLSLLALAGLMARRRRK